MENEEEEVYNGPMVTIKIIGEAFSTDENGENRVPLEVGSVQTLPKPVADDFIAAGVAELFGGETPKQEVTGTEPVETSEVTATELYPLGEVTGTGVRLYKGNVVLSESTRTVNDKPYHVIRLGDGSTYDLTDEEYQLEVTTQ